MTIPPNNSRETWEEVLTLATTSDDSLPVPLQGINRSHGRYMLKVVSEAGIEDPDTYIAEKGWTIRCTLTADHKNGDYYQAILKTPVGGIGGIGMDEHTAKMVCIGRVLSGEMAEIQALPKMPLPGGSFGLFPLSRTQENQMWELIGKAVNAGSSVITKYSKDPSESEL